MTTTPPVNSGSNSQTTQATVKLTKQYSDFLKLLTTQLQNQDPLNPTDTGELTQQIATLSQVEQQINTNTNLEKLLGMIAATQYNSVASYIGKQVEAPGNTTSLHGGAARLAYYLGADAHTVNVTVKNALGDVVYTGESPGKALGRNEYVWNGKNNSGVAQPNGNYTITITAKNANNQDVAMQTYTTGVVTSVDSVDGSTYLSINDMSIPITAVTSIRQPTPSTPPTT